MRSLLAVFLPLLGVLVRAHEHPQLVLEDDTDSGSSVLDYVDPLIGTAGWSGTEYGGMIPNCAPPFAMTQWSPMTRENWISRRPYHHSDTHIHGFIATHQPAIWMGDYGYVVLSPGFGNVTPAFADRGLRFEHARERSTPYHYSVEMDAGKGRRVRAEMAATSRVGHLRFKFDVPSGTGNESARPWVLVQATRAGVVGQISIEHGNGTLEISGSNPDRQDAHLGPFRAASFAGYFVARFNFSSSHRAQLEFGTANHYTLQPNATAGNGTALAAYVRFPREAREVKVRVGTSFVSVEQARRNLDAEAPDGTGLEETARRTRAAWEDKLGRVRIQGGARDQMTIFYTGMYHSLQYPNELLESSSYYSGYTDSVHPHADAAYTSYSTWDVFRAQWAFLILFAPERIDGMVRSMLQTFSQGGWLPIWPNPVETNIMVGTHADSMIAEALAKGFKGFDKELAWEAVWKNAMVPPELDLNLTFYDREQGTPVEARAGLTYYKKNGWVAADRTAAAGSRTLEYAYDDYAASVVAEHTGHSSEAAFFRDRAGSYRHLFHDATGWMESRNLDGSWAGEWVGWTEGDRWVYTFEVMHDIPGLIELMGRDRFVALITEHFVGGHNKHDNEPSHHIPYLYDYLGGNMTARTQRMVREIARQNYQAAVDGLSGNEDCGQMSAWYIFSALGFYPVNPASATYAVGTPFFERVVLRLPSASTSLPERPPLIISAPGASYKPYVRALYVDGRKVERPFVTHEMLVGARVMWFDMSEVPVAWG